MVTTSAWAKYDMWNRAIADVVYPEVDRPLPVYLDLEDEQMESLGDLCGVATEEVSATLCRVVADTLGPALGKGMFREHRRRFRKWLETADKETEPPTLALLAVFSIAAENMARAEGFRQNNFYGRLREALGFESRVVVDSAYRSVAEVLWNGLNDWLFDLNGRRGLPTAVSVSHRYVGLALSQALVRAADRQRFPAFFRRFDLAPGSEIPPGELEPLFDAWISQTPSPATRNLQRLWSGKDSRERVAEGAAVELTHWDGAFEDVEGAPTAGRVLLTLELGGFLSKRLRVRALVYAPSPDVPRSATVHAPDGDVDVPLEPGVAGALDLGTGNTLDPASVFEGALRLTDQLTGLDLEHRPRRLMVFRRDVLSNRLVETNQVMLGDDHALVVHHQLVSRLHEVLAQIARPGWVPVADELPGLPAGWQVVKGVEVFSNPGDLVREWDDLSALIPVTRTNVRLAGGLPLPGVVRNKWHALAPPEVRAVSDAPGFSVTVSSISSTDDEVESSTILDRWTDHDTGVLVRDLSGLRLDDGDYRIELWPDGAKEPVSAQTLRLRSGDTPDRAQWALTEQIDHDLSDPLCVLGAGRGGGDTTIAGAFTTSPIGETSTEPAPDVAWWGAEHKRNSEVAGVRAAPVAPDSCMVTGRHVEQVDYVPTDKLGRALTKSTVGRCLGCGLTRKYSTSYWANYYRHERRKAVVQEKPRDVTELPHVDPGVSERWDLVLDGLMHTGGGAWPLLERLAMTIEPTALFVDHFARTVESLGHVEIRRDPETLRPIAWEVAPTTIVGSPTRWILAGYWTRDLREQLSEALAAAQVELSAEPQREGPTQWYFKASQAIAAEAAKAVGGALVTDAWRRLAATLPTLSAVVDALPRRSAAEAGSLRWFNPRTTSWAPADDLGAVGAYRLGKFVALDVIRTAADVANRTVATSEVRLSKHTAVHMLIGKMLVAYSAATGELRVPLGADLPGLYGRAAVLASGEPPASSGQDLVYRHVPLELAQQLVHLLGS
ncbi:MAG TPA: hypothetical protein VGK17_08225 [Propionicimonas sp.]|jgi:hypothetical protein